MNDLIIQTAKDIIAAEYVTALTGAGISVESGFPPFRGKGGLWEKFDPMEYANIEAFIKNPGKVWKALFVDMKGVHGSAKPNDAHNGLARLEEMGKNVTVITQNVDGLHQMSGSTDVIEFHGSIAWNVCLDCNNKIETSKIDLSEVPPRCACGGVYKPDCVFFGEMIPPESLNRAGEAASQCDLMLVIGTSAVVQPAASMPVIAKKSGAKIIEINLERTPLTGSISDRSLKGGAGDVMNKIIAEVEKLI